MRNPLLIPDLREFINEGETEALRDFFEEHDPPRLAEIIEDLEPAEGDTVLAVLDTRLRAQVVSYLGSERQVELVEAMQPDDAAALLHVMPHDDRADLVERLDEEKAEAILRRLAHAEREDIRRLISYEPGTAGAVMTTDYVALAPHLSVRDAFDRLSREAPDRETILTSYVVDSHRRLIGSVSLPKLVTSRRSQRIEDIMQGDPVSARVDDDQEEVARKIERYDLIAIPIVDADDHLVGIVTHDDALDILRAEQSEDLLAFGGVSMDADDDDTPYWQGRIFSSVRRRIVWLLLLFLGGTLTGLVVRSFHWIEGRFPDIAFDAFIPLLIGTGGNAGSQTVGTIIRGLALGEITPSDAPRVVLRESVTGALLGTLLGSIGFLITWLAWGNSIAFSLVIGLAVLGICVWANAIGALVPILARKTGIDPAVVSAPLISTLVDTTGLLIFYTIAMVVLLNLAPSATAPAATGATTPPAAATAPVE